MKCKFCGVEMRIIGQHYEAEGDTSPGEPTVIYSVMELACRNKQCEHNGQVAETVKTRVN